jgi:hypothetical protein
MIFYDFVEKLLQKICILHLWTEKPSRYSLMNFSEDLYIAEGSVCSAMLLLVCAECGLFHGESI